MFNSIFLICTFTLVLSFYSQNDDEIEWSNDYYLSWDDFKGKVGTGTRDACSVISIEYKDFEWGEKNATCRIVTVFNRTKSWKKSKSDLLLMHEQGHFDINELYARIFRKRIIAKKKFNDKTLTKDFHDIYNSINIMLMEINDLYDKETCFGTNKDKQNEWNEKIDQLLQKYDKYKDCIIKIRIR